MAEKNDTFVFILFILTTVSNDLPPFNDANHTFFFSICKLNTRFACKYINRKITDVSL